MDKEIFIEKLINGLVIATGCTEPVAIAYAGAVAKSYTHEPIKKIQLFASSNIIKNAFVVGIPNTDLIGLNYAVAIGSQCCDHNKKLELLNHIDKIELQKAKKLVDDGFVTTEKLDTPNKLHIKVLLQTENDQISVEIIGTHTNVTSIFKNDIEVYNGNCSMYPDKNIKEDECIDISSIFEFCNTCNIKDLDIIKKSIQINREITIEGLKFEYGLQVGRSIERSIKKNLISNDLVNYAIMRTAAASDARMAGAPLPVMSNSGSGNQGISSTVPVISVWDKMGSNNEDLLIRAVALSSLVTIYIKSKYGVLSALCGAVVASTGASCGVTYLLGGKLQEIEITINNMLGNLTGMLCDGAKSSCSLKISSCTSAALHSSFLAMEHLSIPSNEGIVELSCEKTIANYATLCNEGSSKIDGLILKMILGKDKI